MTEMGISLGFRRGITNWNKKTVKNSNKTTTLFIN